MKKNNKFFSEEYLEDTPTEISIAKEEHQPSLVDTISIAKSYINTDSKEYELDKPKRIITKYKISND